MFSCGEGETIRLRRLMVSDSQTVSTFSSMPRFP